MRDWREGQRRKALHRFCRRSPYALLDRRFRALLVAMLERLGGVESLADMLAQEIKAARANRPSDRLALCGLLTIVRLHEFCESRADAAAAAECDEYRPLTDDELKARTRESIIALIQAEPQIAVVAAKIIGWTVIPPLAGA